MGSEFTFLYVAFFLTIGSFLVGFLVSWNIKAAFDEWQEKADYARIVMHPEMYDADGNFVEDDLFYLRLTEEDDTITDTDD
ncbi:DUF2973 domain-containing protein [Nonlabens xiamenensis]|uniref:DUF2973 domain-containing protein n=1 Tax=Nonlabens xiamenensis TaxID=2341043 RepID=UPI000F60C548|nr:DUF2973 domain-containing protein [Nonlabens xiamenensis]|tara:strand:- start:954 stop:1196 length:243 start_codon:yes stop_codon:yes gene_type:complete